MSRNARYNYFSYFSTRRKQRCTIPAVTLANDWWINVINSLGFGRDNLLDTPQSCFMKAQISFENVILLEAQWYKTLIANLQHTWLYCFYENILNNKHFQKTIAFALPWIYFNDNMIRCWLFLLGVIHKRCPQDFANFWPSSPLSAAVRIEPTPLPPDVWRPQSTSIGKKFLQCC